MGREIEEPARLAGFNEPLHKSGSRLGAVPVALQFAVDRVPCRRLCPRLDHAFQRRAMRFGRGAADRIGDGMDLVAFLQRIERGEQPAGFRP